MRLCVTHATAYSYDQPSPKAAIQILRLTPRNHDGQYVCGWRIDVGQDCRLRRSEDFLGNIAHSFTLDGPIETFTVSAEGEVETQDTSSVVNGAIERFPPALYLRETPLTHADPAIRDFARGLKAHAPLPLLHDLMGALHDRMLFIIGGTNSATSAAEAFALGRGVCQDHAQAFIAAARSLGLPARYVSGYLYREDSLDQEAGHAWAEAYVDGFGWVGFDPANGVCPTEAYVRIAVGLDSLGAAPIRGARIGGGNETLDVKVRVTIARSRV